MLKNMIEQVQSGAIVTLTSEELTELLARAEVIHEADTYLSDMIRILRLDELVLVQETAEQTQVIVRSLPTIEDARAFVARRLETYERMWDGCGCSISYFDP